MNDEEKKQLYKLFLKSFLKIRTTNINDTNLVSFDLFISTTRVYKFTTLKWSRKIKEQAEKCQDFLLTRICDTFKDCSSITVAAESKLIDEIFNKFSEVSENLKVLDNFINFSLDDLEIKKARINISKKDSNAYQQALKRFERLNLFYFEEKIAKPVNYDLNPITPETETILEAQDKSYQQSSKKSSLTVDKSEHEPIFSFSDF